MCWTICLCSMLGQASVVESGFSGWIVGALSTSDAFVNIKCDLSGSNSVVECQLPKLDVAGSNPVSRSIFSITCKPLPKSATSINLVCEAPQ
jgi:hypothetical protein